MLKRELILFVKNLRFLSAIAPRLVKLTGKSPFAIHPKHLLSGNSWFLPYLDSSDIVLDVGCGNGSNSLIAARKVRKVHGVDGNPKAVHLAAQICKKTKLTNFDFQNVDIERGLPFKNGAFDKVLLLDVLEHIHHRALLLSEIKRVLKKNGLFLLTVPNKNSSWKKMQRSVGLNSFTDADHKIEYSLSEIKKFLQHHCLTVVKTSLITLDTPLAPAIDLVGGISLSLYRQLDSWKRQKIKSRPEETSGYRVVCRYEKN